MNFPQNQTRGHSQPVQINSFFLEILWRKIFPELTQIIEDLFQPSSTLQNSIEMCDKVKTFKWEISPVHHQYDFGTSKWEMRVQCPATAFLFIFFSNCTFHAGYASVYFKVKEKTVSRLFILSSFFLYLINKVQLRICSTRFCWNYILKNTPHSTQTWMYGTTQTLSIKIFSLAASSVQFEISRAIIFNWHNCNILPPQKK